MAEQDGPLAVEPVVEDNLTMRSVRLRSDETIGQAIPQERELLVSGLVVTLMGLRLQKDGSAHLKVRDYVAKTQRAVVTREVELAVRLSAGRNCIGHGRRN